MLGKTAHALARSLQIFRQAIPQMSSLKIPVTPENYAVWYHYVMGYDLALKHEIEQRLRQQQAFDSRVNDTLYTTYIQRDPSQRFENVHNETQKLIASLVEQIRASSAGTRAFSEVLGELDAELAQPSSPEQLSQMIRRLTAGVTEVLNNNQQMESSLTQLSQDASGLRQELAQVREQALLDPLTSLYNRRALEHELNARLLAYTQTREDCCLILLDVDHFKRFNDTYGHAVGDQVLRFVAMTLRRVSGQEPFIARYGGEEFVLVLPQWDYGKALVLAEQIRLQIAQQNLATQQGQQPIGHITVSLGVACMQASDDAEGLLIRADKAMYQAKQQGRDQVVGERDRILDDVGA
ncbi:GGDEF domain-containing protein [Ferrimonas pelagia]|uniref:diguanylate cyclase n=1 Tax=Ferrimonas pelagia TaxID=1177826 RepID=A0ABP9EHE2_9GAMM